MKALVAAVVHTFSVAGVLALAATGAHAADWIKAATTTGRVTFLDRASLERDGNISKGWMKEVYGKPDLHYVGLKPVPYRVVLYHVVWDCSHRTSGLLEEVFFKDLAQQVFIDRQELTPPIQMGAIIPDSVGEAQHALACKLSAPR